MSDETKDILAGIFGLIAVAQIIIILSWLIP